MMILGNALGAVSLKPDWNQQDQQKPDYIRGKETVENALAGKQNKHSTAVVTLSAGGWSEENQTVAHPGMTANTTIIVAAAPENYDPYAKAGVYCSAQGADSLTFSCKSAPEGDLRANIMILT